MSNHLHACKVGGPGGIMDTEGPGVSKEQTPGGGGPGANVIFTRTCYSFLLPKKRPHVIRFLILPSTSSLFLPVSDGLWPVEVQRTSHPLPPSTVGIMSPTSDHLPDGASSIARGRVEVCLHQISRGSIGVGLWWICLNPVLVRLCLGVYRCDPSDL